MMLNLLIVDDEADIADSLYMYFKQTDVIELDVYKAYSANEALEWLNKTKIDIVLSDICMPGMDGLQLLEVIKAKWPKSRVIFLTGYNEFDYIYSATRTEGIRYLLKTEGYEEIVSAVQKAADDIGKDMEVNELVNNAKAQISLARPLLQKEFLMELLNEGRETLQERKKQFDNLEIQLDASAPVMLLLGRIDNLKAGSAERDKSQVFFAINLILVQLLSGNVKSFFVGYDRSTLLWFFQPRDGAAGERGANAGDNSMNIQVFVKGMLENVQTACKNSIGYDISFAIDFMPFSWEETPERFSHLKQLLNYRIGTGVDGLILDGSLPLAASGLLEQDVTDAQKLHLQLKKLGELESLLENGRREEFLIVLSSLLECLKSVQSKNHNPSLELFYSVSIMLLSYINRWNLTEKIAFKIGLSKLTRVDEHPSWKDSVEYFYQLANVIFDIQKREEDKRAETAIKHICEYIDAHLGEDLSLAKLAEQVYFNPSYLSRLFKQVTGRNIQTYINDARLVMSKELICNSNLKINEIAFAVGYISATYFNRFFKKATNMSPLEYREHASTSK